MTTPGGPQSVADAVLPPSQDNFLAPLPPSYESETRFRSRYIAPDDDAAANGTFASFAEAGASSSANVEPRHSSKTIRGTQLGLELMGFSTKDVKELTQSKDANNPSYTSVATSDTIDVSDVVPADVPPLNSNDLKASGIIETNGNGFDKPAAFDETPPPRKPTFMSMYKEEGVWNAIWWRTKKFLINNWGTLLFLFIMGLILMFLGIFAFDPLSWKGWMAFAITLLMLGFLVNGQFAVQVVVLAAATAMLTFQLITPSQALVGFSNTGVASVAALFAFSEGMERTSVLRPVFRFLMGAPKKLWVALLRLCVPMAFFSAFFHNTPIVAMLLPIVIKWSRQNGLSPSKILMPMNNSTVLGGVISVLGTSTNLIVVGLAEEAGLTDKEGNPLNFPIFGMAPAGIPVCCVGILYCIIAAHFLLKDRQPGGASDVAKNPRQYTVALQVLERSPIVGESIQDAGLRNLQGLFLVELTRADGTSIPAPSHDVIIMAGDILLFAGVVETVKELYHIPGLVPATAQSEKIKLERHRRRLVEVVISPSCDMVGYTVKETKFRTRFGAAIIAVHRHGEHVTEKIGDIVIRAGDVFLLETSEEFMQHYGRSHTFALVSEVTNSTPPREDLLHMLIAGVTAVTFIVVTAADWLDILTMALISIFFMAITGCMTMAQAGSAVSIPVLLTIACSFAISAGLEKTGAAAQVTNFIIDVFDFAPIGLIFGIYIGTVLLSAVLTNNAAVALMFPIVADPTTGIINQMDVNPYAALYAMMFAASLSFSTPIGYQTNLMVHGPGGYKFTDWVIFGLPLDIICCIVASVLCYFIWQ